MSEELIMFGNCYMILGWLILLVSLKKGWNLSWKKAIAITLLLFLIVVIGFAFGLGAPRPIIGE